MYVMYLIKLLNACSNGPDSVQNSGGFSTLYIGSSS